MKVLALGAGAGAEHPFPPWTERQAAAETETIAASCQGQWWGEGGKAFCFMLYSHCGLLKGSINHAEQPWAPQPASFRLSDTLICMLETEHVPFALTRPAR